MQLVMSADSPRDNSICILFSYCHSHESGNPVGVTSFWIRVFKGMTGCYIVIPTKVGIQWGDFVLDSRFHGNDRGVSEKVFVCCNVLISECTGQAPLHR